MREIKFRAWDMRNNKMHIDFMSHVELCTAEGFGNPWRDNQYIPMQCTGLKDKNGKEIYEGDIVLYPDTESEHVDVGVGVPYKVAEQPMNSFFPVQFVDGGFGLKVTDGEVLEHRWYWLAEVLFNEGLTLDIIGNIYSNPELLTK